MDKPNIFKSSRFHMDAEDVLHILVKDLTGTGVTIALSNDTGGTEIDEDSEVIGSPTTTVAPSPLKDKDGNEYTSIQIGTQEWIVENYRTTKYADGTSIRNIIEDDTVLEYVGYVASSFNTFTTVGLNITSCISDGISPDTADFADILDDANFEAYPYYELVFTISNFILNSGTAPYLLVRDEDTNTLIYEGQLADGVVTVPITTHYTGINVQISNSPFIGAPFNACDCSVDISVAYGGWANDTTGAYCYYDNDEATYKGDYGALYNWYAINNVKGLAYLERGGAEEVGWRVPTETDFTTLSTFLGGDLISGGKLKEAGTTHWSAPNTGATDDEGFMAMPSGIRLSTGTFLSIGESLEFGTSTESSPTELMAIGLSYDSAETVFDPGGKAKGYAIRLVRDI